MKNALFITFFFLSFSSFSEEPILQFNIKVFNDLTGGALIGAEVQVYADDVLLVEEIAGNNGKIVNIDVAINKIYRIYFKKKGFVTKIVEIDAFYDKPQNLPKLDFLLMEVRLFKTDINVDLAFLEDTPMYKFKYNSEGVMQYNREYTEEILRRIEDVRKR